MLRLTKSDLFLLPPDTRIEPPSAEGLPPAPRAPSGSHDAPRPAQDRKALRSRGPAKPIAATSPIGPDAVNSKCSQGAGLRFELARALPALWAKAKQDFAEGRADHEKAKLRELILWLLSKKCTDVRQRQSVNFLHEGHRTSGRVDVVAYPVTGPALAIEMDWTYARKSLEKLQAAHGQGWEVMWVCGAKMDKNTARALRARANQELGPTFRWLYMFHLEHGWL